MSEVEANAAPAGPGFVHPGAVIRRRALCAAAGHELPKKSQPGDMGLAFSGGGIRSATVSLGLAQALAKKQRLLDFDYCSTVSGGGYFGSFLRGLFLPGGIRGTGNTPDSDSLVEKSEFAHSALVASANAREIPGVVAGTTVRNPVWWLREHSRYLAPNGSSDYIVAATYMVRNWLAMIYVTILPLMLFALVAIGISAWLVEARFDWVANHLAMGEGTWLLSPLLLVSGGFMLLHFGCGIGYWLTEGMSEGVLLNKAKDRRWSLALSSVIAAAAMLVLWAVFERLSGNGAFAPTLPLTGLVCLGVFPTLFGAALGLRYLALRKSASGASLADDGFTAAVRRRLTRLGAILLGGAGLFAVLALVDTAGMALFAKLAWVYGNGNGVLGTVSTAVLPLLAWLINRLSGMGGGKMGKLLGSRIGTVALIVGGGLYLMLAVLVHVLAQAVLFGDSVWVSLKDSTEFGHAALSLGGDAPWVHIAATGMWARFWFVTVVIAFLTVVTGSFTGFINLSSLHGLYAARLTRAYMGATNLVRLAAAAASGKSGRITESDPGDQVPVRTYQQQDTLAPIHLINVTLNETRSVGGSQLLERDRKGVPIVFAPEGVWLDPAQNKQPYSWQQLERENVETLSVGQLCAISGAAASSAMGSRTTLGGALAMTFANIRLGYWWNVRDLVRGKITLKDNPGTWLYNTLTRPLRTYFYLRNEMVSNYSRQYARLNISDGGHFENSGAYELLRRRVKLIVTADNGADPDYGFEDLELLVRKARIDLGLSVNVAAAESVCALVGKSGAALFLNGDGRDWRERVQKRDPGTPDDGAYCLLLHVYDTDVRAKPIARIVWMKPRLFRGVPQDVVGYARRKPSFPQETTGDQFFDEAQWESYRALGYCMMMRLLEHTAHEEDVLRHLVV